LRDRPDPIGNVRRRPPRFVRRLRNHAALGAASSVATVLIFGAIRSTDAMFRASMATAYVGLLLLAVTLAFGPVAALRGRRYPVTTDLRRDVGIWAAIVSIAHVVIGLQVHLRGKMWEYFVHSVGGTFLPRIDPFGAANYAGAAATFLLAVLLVTSNDAALRRLGVTGWRSVHKWVEWVFVLTLLHATIYQFVEKRDSAIVVGLMLVSIIVISMRIQALRVRGNT
jgi:methionine sulfoxide reductase heme-binding subunit